ncbi:hypothetical protein BKA82DRAFT_4224247 [Pisolithus tinctorius]|nr:hypothetical protein BKA82DRAFT_4224247 [Pisolithus tinctorius]
MAFATLWLKRPTALAHYLSSSTLSLHRGSERLSHDAGFFQGSSGFLRQTLPSYHQVQMDIALHSFTSVFITPLQR